MPLSKIALPILASCSVGSVTSYGCYVHISNSSSGTSARSNNSPSINTVEKPTIPEEGANSGNANTNTEGSASTTNPSNEESTDASAPSAESNTTDQTIKNEEQPPATDSSPGTTNDQNDSQEQIAQSGEEGQESAQTQTVSKTDSSHLPQPQTGDGATGTN